MKRLLPLTSHRPGPGSRLRRATGATRINLHDEHGDVPGWALVTLMTAGLAVTLWTVADSTLTEAFLSAIVKMTSMV